MRDNYSKFTTVINFGFAVIIVPEATSCFSLCNRISVTLVCILQHYLLQENQQILFYVKSIIEFRAKRGVLSCNESRVINARNQHKNNSIQYW